MKSYLQYWYYKKMLQDFQLKATVEGIDVSVLQNKMQFDLVNYVIVV